MADQEIPLGRTPVYELLSEADVQKIVDAIFQLLRETGVAFDPDPRVLDLFSDAGCEISADHVVRFETDFVKECLQSLARVEGQHLRRPRHHHAGGRRAAERGRRVPDGQGRSGLDPPR
jgi:trimethylamine:corrinoid methyltransferase-like protein